MPTAATVADGADTSVFLGLDAGDTLLTVSAGHGVLFATGDLIKIDDELLFVSSVLGDVLTVIRGSLGTLDVSHADGSVISLLDCPPETVELILRTLNANSFNFIAVDLGSGVHTVEIEAMVDVNCTRNTVVVLCDGADANVSATGVIGQGSVTIETVRMIKDEDVELP